MRNFRFRHLIISVIFFSLLKLAAKKMPRKFPVVGPKQFLKQWNLQFMKTIFYTDDFPGVARIIFQKDCGLYSKYIQWRIELLYRYKRAKSSRITVLNIRKLYLYFTLNCMFTLSEDRQSLWKTMRGKWPMTEAVLCKNSMINMHFTCSVVHVYRG